MTRAITNLLRADEAIRHLHSRANSYLCEHRLAKVAHDIERDHGEVLFDRRKFDDRVTYKFHAARPVSLRVHGRRDVPISAWAAWGASATLSFVRHDAYHPLDHLGGNLLSAIKTVYSMPSSYYVGTCVGAYLGVMYSLALQVRTRLFTRSHRALTMLVDRVPLINNLGPGGLAVKTGLTVYSAAGLLGVAEMLLGAPHRCRQDVHPPPDPQRVALFHALREHGVLYGVRCAVEKLDPPQLNGFLKKTSFCLAAVVGATLLVADLGAAMAQLGVLTGVATVAAGGALMGVTLGVFAYFRGPWGWGQTVPLRHVQFDQNHMAYDRHLYLGMPIYAPEIRHRRQAPSNRRDAYRFEPQDMPRAAGLGRDEVVQENRPLNDLLRQAEEVRVRNRLARAADGQPAPHPRIEPEIPLANVDDGHVDANVHGWGRDAATRRSVAALLRRYPRVNEAAEIRDMAEWLRRQPAWVLQEDERDIQFEVMGRARQALSQYRIFNENNTVTIEHGFGIQTMARICATIWHAIAQLQALENTPEANQALRFDRKRSFVRAAAECSPRGSGLVCAPGQSQRLILVLQGFVPDVQVERYDAPVAVNTFLTQQLAYLGREIAEQENPDEQLIRRHLDEAYMAGRALYVGEDLQNLTQQLTDFAGGYDINDWRPAA